MANGRATTPAVIPPVISPRMLLKCKILN
jgi:hypothetical protein